MQWWAGRQVSYTTVRMTRKTDEYTTSGPGKAGATRLLTARLQAGGIRISMDGRGRCMDNILIERLWRNSSNRKIDSRGF